MAKKPKLKSADPIASYATAKTYVQSAYALMDSAGRRTLPNDSTVFLPFHLLCGFAIEIYLKAYLTHRQLPAEKLLNFRVRHNLKRLRTMAKTKGLDCSDFNGLVDLLHESHKKHHFRYMPSKKIFKHQPLAVIFSQLSALDVAVDSAIGASKSKGKIPEPGWHFYAHQTPWRL